MLFLPNLPLYLHVTPMSPSCPYNIHVIPCLHHVFIIFKSLSPCFHHDHIISMFPCSIIPSLPLCHSSTMSPSSPCHPMFPSCPHHLYVTFPQCLHHVPITSLSPFYMPHHIPISRSPSNQVPIMSSSPYHFPNDLLTSLSSPCALRFIPTMPYPLLACLHCVMAFPGDESGDTLWVTVSCPS